LSTSHQFIAFALVGLASTIFNLASRYGFELFFTYEFSLIGANAVGVISAFLMNRWFVFRSTDSQLLTELTRFVAVNLVGIAVAWGVAVLLYRQVFPALAVTWHPDLLAHAIGIAVPVLPNYFAHKVWTFNR